MAWPRRWCSAGISAGATVRFWMTSASASRTTAVLITTPGETPMPLRISIGLVVSGRWPVVRFSLARRPLATDHSLFLTKLTRKQFSQLVYRLLSVGAIGFNHQLRIFGRFQHD